MVCRRGSAGILERQPLPGDQPSLYHRPQFLRQLPDLLLAVDDFDHHREVIGESKDAGGVNLSRPAEPFDAPQDSGARDSDRLRAIDDRPVEGFPEPAVPLGKIDPKDDAFEARTRV